MDAPDCVKLVPMFYDNLKSLVFLLCHSEPSSMSIYFSSSYLCGILLLTRQEDVLEALSMTVKLLILE